MPSLPKHDMESDSEDDGDYVPPEGQDSDSGASDVETNDKKVAPTTTETVDEAERKRQVTNNAREALWASFQESVNQPTAHPDRPISQPQLVKIERRRLFAGEEVLEVVEVPADSPEVKKWPLWVDPQQRPVTTSGPTSTENTATPSRSEFAKEDNASAPSASVDVPQPATSTLHPQPKRAGPRKSKITLGPLPGANKAKKMTTLDKSSLDWKTHLQTESAAGSSVTDELAANRRAGGYLEKVEFLKRVEERKDETLETLKSNKRRRL